MNVPRGGVKRPSWWGVRRPSWWGPLNILPQPSIFGHYLTPKSVKIHPRPFQTKRIWLRQKAYLVISGTVPLKDDFYKGDNGSPTGVDRRHDGPSHWLFHPQRCWDLVLSSQVSLTFPPWQLLFLSTTFSSAGSSCQLSSHGLMCSLLSRGDFQMMWRGRIRSRISQNWHSTVPYCYLFAHILASRVDGY